MPRNHFRSQLYLHLLWMMRPAQGITKFEQKIHLIMKNWKHEKKKTKTRCQRKMRGWHIDYAWNKSEYNRFGLVIINDNLFFSCVFFSAITRDTSHLCRDNKLLLLIWGIALFQVNSNEEWNSNISLTFFPPQFSFETLCEYEFNFQQSYGFSGFNK